MFIIYVIDLLTKIQCKDGVSYFYKNKKYRPLEKEKKIFFFSYLISEIPNFWYMRFFRKCSMFRRGISLRERSSNVSGIAVTTCISVARSTTNLFLLVLRTDPLALLRLGTVERGELKAFSKLIVGETCRKLQL